MKSYISAWPCEAKAPGFPRAVVILGSTGSIGTSALRVVEQHPDLFTVAGLAGGRNVELLARQAARFRPPMLAILDPGGAKKLKSSLPPGYAPEILVGPHGYAALAALPEASLVLSAIVGAAGFLPTLAAARAGKLVALANKESLVLGGGLIRRACRESGAVLLPVDSEHSALFQCLLGHGGADVRRLILTASGGPFRGKTREFLSSVTAKQALNHPNWSMGAKITIDSATLMNKGLEVIEACHLYGLPVESVDVVVHPQSIVHSLVEYEDGSQLAHLGVPDMQIPIAYCLCFPRRVALTLPALDLVGVGALTFERPDLEAFPCLGLAREAFRAGPSHPVVLNAANEVAVDLFLQGKIAFLDIPAAIGRALSAHGGAPVDTAEEILALDAEARGRTLADLAQRPAAH